MSISIAALYQAGTRLLMQEHREAEAGKKGILRAGNTGIILPAKKNGGPEQVIGKCARLTYLRLLGVDVEAGDESRELMFAGGRGNEDLWVDILKRVWDGPILRESEVPIKWEAAGVAVTGRPDIVLCREEEVPFKPGSGRVVPVKGIELKLVSSVWTARDVGFQMKPKTMHLLQAGHYAWQVGVPFELWYTSRVDFAVMGWAGKHFPKLGQPGSERCKYNDKGEILKVLPFLQGYELQWNVKGQLQYRPVGPGLEPGEWTFTLITIDGIKRYYETVATMQQTGKLPARPSNTEADGRDGRFNICSYCPLQATCDSHEDQGLAAWVEQATKVAPTNDDKNGETRA